MLEPSQTPSADPLALLSEGLLHHLPHHTRRQVRVPIRSLLLQACITLYYKVHCVTTGHTSPQQSSLFAFSEFSPQSYVNACKHP